MRGCGVGEDGGMATYAVNDGAVAHARRLIDARQYVLDSDWGESQPDAEAAEPLPREAPVGGLRRLAPRADRRRQRRDKARHAFVYGDFRRVHRSGLIACVYRAAEWRHKQVELAAHDLLQRLDQVAGIGELVPERLRGPPAPRHGRSRRRPATPGARARSSSCWRPSRTRCVAAALLDDPRDDRADGRGLPARAAGGAARRARPTAPRRRTSLRPRSRRPRSDRPAPA